MRKYKSSVLIIFLNLSLSLLIVHFSPRLDIITLFSFIITNGILLSLLLLNNKKREEIIEEKINDVFSLLHSLDTDSNYYEVIDDEFGKLRDEIIKIIIEKKHIVDNATNSEQILREYTEDIAHQIKTPLTGALLILDLMEEDKENHKEYIAKIRDSINRLHQLADILLKLASLDSGIIEMKKEPVPIKELIENIIMDIETCFIKNNFNIPIHGDDFILLCDKRWTYEAILNIVKNGMEASDNRNVTIYLNETNLFKSIIVEDFSSGLSNAMLKKAYKRFYKKDPNSKGYGIGLPIAKSVMEKQNGELLYCKGRTSNTFELRFYK